MDELKLKQIQSYFDATDNNELDLWFGEHSLTVDGILVSLRGVPLLRNPQNGKIYFPNRTKYMIEYFLDDAKRNAKAGVDLFPKTPLGKKRYNFARDFNFSYSSIDYEYIPGLVRAEDDGFLTPIFFKLSVLNKYSQNPNYSLDLFSETYGGIRKGDEWHIAFGINKNQKVIMWLGDIDILPEDEKYYLRSENIDSDHDIHSEFYNAQIEVHFSEPSLQSSLFHLRSTLKKYVQENYNFEIYMLEGEVSEVISNLHRPIFWEDKHVGPVIESFNRIFVESINSKTIKINLKAIDSSIDVSSKGSLKLLEIWLERCLSLKNAKEIMSPFYVLYDFRIITCHLCSKEEKSNRLESINDRLKLKLDNTDYEKIYDELIKQLSISYQAIIESVL